MRGLLDSFGGGLTVSKNAEREEESIHVRVTVVNRSGATHSNVKVSDQLPYGTDSYTLLTEEAQVVKIGDTLKWSITNLPPGGRKVLAYIIPFTPERVPDALIEGSN